MVELFSDQVRLLTLIVGCAALWSVESVAPLYIQANRFRRSISMVFSIVNVVERRVLNMLKRTAPRSFRVFGQGTSVRWRRPEAYRGTD